VRENCRRRKFCWRDSPKRGLKEDGPVRWLGGCEDKPVDSY